MVVDIAVHFSNAETLHAERMQGAAAERDGSEEVSWLLGCQFHLGVLPGLTGVLDVLARHGIRATFFVLGRNLASKETKALVRRAAEEGHWIGNHTYSHAVPLGTTTDPDAPAKEIGATQALIGELAHPDKLFRPFGGGGILGPHLLIPAAASVVFLFPLWGILFPGAYTLANLPLVSCARDGPPPSRPWEGPSRRTSIGS